MKGRDGRHIRGTTLQVDYGDLIVYRNENMGYGHPQSYLECKLCGGISDKGMQCRGIHHKGNCVVGRWELRKVIQKHRNRTYEGYCGGYHFSVWPNCGDEMRAENDRRVKAGLPTFERKDIIISNTYN